MYSTGLRQLIHVKRWNGTQRYKGEGKRGIVTKCHAKNIMERLVRGVGLEGGVQGGSSDS